MKLDLTREITFGQSVSARLDGSMLTIKGAKGEVSREFRSPKIRMTLVDKKVLLTVQKATKREKTMIGTFEAHITNMVKGVEEPHLYKLKVCSGHFPMNVSISGKEFVIKNFLGEAVPRKVSIIPGVAVKIEGNDVTVSCPDKELAGKMASLIENLCRITNRDRRIFQDGCYITEKVGKKM